MKFAALISTKLGKSILTLTAISALGTVGALSTFAGLADSATLPAVAVVKGGTLDIDASGNLVSSDLSDIANMKPGESLSADILVKNKGKVRAVTSVTGAFTSSGCFSYTLKDGADTLLAGSGNADVATIAAGASKTLTLTVTEGECQSATGDNAVAPEASLSLKFDAVQATGKG
ncbi:MAG: hypothetical protein JWM86_2878 [Thermoleophilia bacterium]|nr:hypothetical protein [Thermoleophilia bacterium]